MQVKVKGGQVWSSQVPVLDLGCLGKRDCVVLWGFET